MGNELQQTTVAFLAAPEGVEEVELAEPWSAVTKAGGQAKLISTSTGKARAFRHLSPGAEFDIDIAVDRAEPAEFDALVLPGGVANPDFLRTHAGAVAFAKSFFDAGKPVGVICHGPWTLVEADVVRGRRITSWPSLATDIRNAGGDWVDEELVVCERGPNTLISSRKPDDLPAFCAALTERFRGR